MTRPLIIGLTGSIGMGKSAVAKMFAAQGVAVFDADAAVHELQGPGSMLLDGIEKAFPGTTDINGVDRKKLGQMVLGNVEKLARLEAIIHPAVAKMRKDFLEMHHNDDIIVFDIPLLFEKGGEGQVDHVLVVSAPEEIQRKRVLSRSGMTAERLDQILALQMPDAEKQVRADHVVNTGQSIEATQADVRKLLKTLRQTLAHKMD